MNENHLVFDPVAKDTDSFFLKKQVFKPSHQFSLPAGNENFMKTRKGPARTLKEGDSWFSHLFPLYS